MNTYSAYGVDDKVAKLIDDTEEQLSERFLKIDKRAEKNFYKVLKAFQDNKVSYDCMNGSTGYGYDDAGRDTLEKIYADVFRAEAALVRPQIACGTHAITVALSAILRPGDELLSPVGKVYDSLEEVIGIRESKGSLREYGISYKQVELKPDGSPDYDGIKAAISEKTKVVTIQRSRGYSFRPSLSCQVIKEIIDNVKSVKSDVICFVDNCYGEFVEETEPIEAGADLVAGSLIKNPGGGLAPLGGYIVGKSELVEEAAARLLSPGLGREVGATVSVMRAFYQGLFLAPTVVASALKGAILGANVYEKLGFYTHPNGSEDRYDIIQAIRLETSENLLAFCRGIQKAAPVDSYVTPMPWDMPGYGDQVIMAAGAFISGSSMELSADGPLREPYNVYFQGGLTYPHSKLGIVLSANELSDCRGF